jgi:hypothetical protein
MFSMGVYFYLPSVFHRGVPDIITLLTLDDLSCRWNANGPAFHRYSTDYRYLNIVIRLRVGWGGFYSLQRQEFLFSPLQQTAPQIHQIHRFSFSVGTGGYSTGGRTAGAWNWPLTSISSRLLHNGMENFLSAHVFMVCYCSCIFSEEF